MPPSRVVAAAAAGSVVAFLVLRRLLQSLQAAAEAAPFVLLNVRVPASLLPDALAPHADAEGLVLLHVRMEKGVITDVGQEVPPTPHKLDMGGAVVLPCFADAHTHLVKTHIATRLRNPTGSINDALCCEVDDHPNWKAPNDVARRMDFALRCAYHHGTRAVRTHLDGTNCLDDEALVACVFAAYAEARSAWSARGLELCGVANLYLPLWLGDGAAAFADRAAAQPGVALGAYCGNVSKTPAKDTRLAFDAIFRHAARVGRDVDLHIDETNEPKCCALLPLCDSLRDARAAGYTGHVVLGHATSLALQSAEVRTRIVSALAGDPGGVTVVCNPFTNMCLQDRRGTNAMAGAPIAADVARTPHWRGLTAVQELQAAGVAVAAASDNVRDHWCACGSDYDGLAVLRDAMAVGQLDTAPTAGAWAPLVTSAPARALGCGGGVIAPGEPADVILFPSARHMNELLSRPQSDRVVLRGGQPQQTALPKYAELDDLVAKEVQRSGAGEVQRGATKVDGGGAPVR